jgi:DNA repair exonuclease SbcCD ATPase subunit
LYLSGVRVENFQAYGDSGEVVFQPGFNLLIGTNNSGKSSFLQALTHTLEDIRHQPENWPRGSDLPPPSVTMTIETSGHAYTASMSFKHADCAPKDVRGTSEDAMPVICSASGAASRSSAAAASPPAR